MRTCSTEKQTIGPARQSSSVSKGMEREKKNNALKLRKTVQTKNKTGEGKMKLSYAGVRQSRT